MSIKSPSVVEEIALEELCAYCLAEPGEWCRSPRGRKSTWLHADRSRALERAHWSGHQHGYVTALEAAADNMQAVRDGSYWALRSGVPLVDVAVIAYLRRLAGRD